MIRRHVGLTRHVGPARSVAPARHRRVVDLVGAVAVAFSVLAAQVFARDGHRCRACHVPVDVNAPITELSAAHPHHILLRSKGGVDSSTNLCTLCARCHARAHGTDGSRLRITGNADVCLSFSRAGHTWTSRPALESFA